MPYLDNSEGDMLDKFIKTVDFINRWAGRCGSFLVIVLTILVVLEVVMRYLFGRPTTWSFEVTKMIYGFYFMILGGYTLQKKGHVAIDVIYEMLKPKTRAILDIISYLIFFFPFCTVVLIEGIKFAKKSWQISETSWSVFAPPLYPIKTVIPVAVALMLLQGIAIFISHIRFLIKER
ncbi:TRAP transporter small permease subunit [Desulfosarcina alkanivorans]|nr:TRAP transporter small permease subunit [Desulfosarcina alkanivorans]